jgi:hypothetical protein
MYRDHHRRTHNVPVGDYYNSKGYKNRDPEEISTPYRNRATDWHSHTYRNLQMKGNNPAHQRMENNNKDYPIRYLHTTAVSPAH